MKKSSSHFHDVSIRWLHMARKCVEVSLVDVVRTFQSPTCEDIKRRAFVSHFKCFHYISDESPSVCDIGHENWLKIFVTVISAMTNRMTFEDSLVSAGKCYRLKLRPTVNMIVSWNDTKVTELENLIADVTDSANKQLANDVFMVVLNGDELTNSREKKDTIADATMSTIELLLVPRNQYDFNYHGVSTLNTDELVKSFLDNVESKKITHKAIDGIELLE